MANTVTDHRLSESVKTRLVENAAIALNASTVKVPIAATKIEAYDRATIQFRNTDSQVITAKAWGTLYSTPDATPETNSKWVQIGDDITVSANSGSIKSISTTGLKSLAITCTIASGTPTVAAGDVKVFLQGTI